MTHKDWPRGWAFLNELGNKSRFSVRTTGQDGETAQLSCILKPPPILTRQKIGQAPAVTLDIDAHLSAGHAPRGRTSLIHMTLIDRLDETIPLHECVLHPAICGCAIEPTPGKILKLIMASDHIIDNIKNGLIPDLEQCLDSFDPPRRILRLLSGRTVSYDTEKRKERLNSLHTFTDAIY